MLDKGAAIKVAEGYAQKVRPEFKPVSMWLFGSYAKGDARDWSDIDIAVVVKKGFDGDWWRASSRLCRLSDDIDVTADNTFIEPHLVEEDEDDDFYNEIIRTGIPI